MKVLLNNENTIVYIGNGDIVRKDGGTIILRGKYSKITFPQYCFANSSIVELSESVEIPEGKLVDQYKIINGEFVKNKNVAFQSDLENKNTLLLNFMPLDYQGADIIDKKVEDTIDLWKFMVENNLFKNCSPAIKYGVYLIDIKDENLSNDQIKLKKETQQIINNLRDRYLAEMDEGDIYERFTKLSKLVNALNGQLQRLYRFVLHGDVIKEEMLLDYDFYSDNLLDNSDNIFGDEISILEVPDYEDFSEYFPNNI